MDDYAYIMCRICGRLGTRAFTWFNGEQVCANDRACRRRAEQRGYPWPYKL